MNGSSRLQTRKHTTGLANECLSGPALCDLREDEVNRNDKEPFREFKALLRGYGMEGGAR